MKNILILGAKSDVGMELAKKYASEGFNLYLASRKSNELEEIINDIKIRNNIEIINYEFDILDFFNHKTFIENLPEFPIGVILCIGYLGDQYTAEGDLKETQKILNTNFIGPVSILNYLVNDFERKKDGFIVVLSSVAGDRGRLSNYIYGSSKGGLNQYLSGIRNRLFKSNVSVLTVKPGFIKSKMTAHLLLPNLLTSKPREVAEIIYKSVKKNKDEIYIKNRWRVLMIIIKLIPEKIFKRLKL